MMTSSNFGDASGIDCACTAAAKKLATVPGISRRAGPPITLLATDAGLLQQRARAPPSIRRGRPLQSQIENATLQRDHHGVGAVRRVELRKNALHVCFDGTFGDFQLRRDQLVGLTRSHTPQHFDFTLRQ